MRPVIGGSQRPVAATPYTPSVPGVTPSVDLAPALEERRARLLEVLSSEEQGMTIGRMASRLGSPREGLEALVAGLVESQVVGRLNTVIPTYVYRGEAPAPDTRVQLPRSAASAR